MSQEDELSARITSEIGSKPFLIPTETATAKRMSYGFQQALFNACQEMEPVTKDKNNPAFGRGAKYADINSVLREIQPALRSYGLRLSQMAEDGLDTSRLYLRTRITHWESGESDEFLSSMPLPKNDPQGFGSAMTYLRRYVLFAYFGLSAEDDDGQAAMPVSASPGLPKPSVTPRVGEVSPRATTPPVPSSRSIGNHWVGPKQ